MPITFHCPHCDAKYSDVKDSFDGRPTRCRRCGRRFRIRPVVGEPLPEKATTAVDETPGLTDRLDKIAAMEIEAIGDVVEEKPPVDAVPSPTFMEVDDISRGEIDEAPAEEREAITRGADVEEEEDAPAATQATVDEPAIDRGEVDAVDAVTIIADDESGEELSDDTALTIDAGEPEEENDPFAATRAMADEPDDASDEPAPMETLFAPPPAETIRADVEPAETLFAAPPPAETIFDRAEPAETMVEPSGDAPAAVDEDRLIAQAAGAAPVEEADVAADWNPGDTILGLYRVIGLLGEGGMGKVYKVRHLGWNVELAVKSPKPEELERAGGAENFVAEAETWVNLGLHPHTVSCYYVRKLGGVPRLFAEYVDGGSLSDWIREGRLTDPAHILDIMIQFAWGLHYSHERGLVHQDVKPANVMMTAGGAAKVTDFGLAKARGGALEQGDGGGLVAFGGMTPAYCSPEQAEKKRLSPKTDMWSWGASVLEIYAGELTWMYGVAAPDALAEYLKTGPAKPGLPTMPTGVADLLGWVFAADPADRPADMKAVADTVVEIYRSVTGAKYPRPYPQAGRDTAASLNNRAISLLDLGRGREAMTLWNEAMSREPHHPETTYNYGLTQWRLGRMTDSGLIGLMEEAVKSHGPESGAAYYLGLLHLERDDCAAARTALAAVDDDNPAAEEADTARREAGARADRSRRAITLYAGHTAPVSSMAVSGDGKRLVTGSDDHTARLWDLISGAPLKTFEHGPRAVTAVGVSPDGAVVATGGYRTAILWSVETGKAIKELAGHDDWVTAVAFTPDGARLLTHSWDATARLWEVATGVELSVIDGAAGPAAITPDGRFALFGAEDATVALFDVASALRRAIFDVAPGAMAITDDAATVCLADLDGGLLLFDADAPHAPKRRLEGSHAPVAALAFSPDGRYLLSSAYDKSVRLWETATGRCLRTFTGHDDTPAAVAFTPDGADAISSGWDGKVIRWTVETGARPFTAPMVVSRIQASERVLLAGAAYEEGLTRMRHALDQGDTLAAVRHLRHARSQPGFGRGAEALTAWGDLYRRLPRITLKGGWESFALPGHAGEVAAVAVTPDGRRALTASHDQTARLWNIDDRTAIRTLAGHGSRVTAAAFSHDGRLALTASADTTLTLWESETGERLATMTGSTGPINAAALSPDGAVALSGGDDMMVRVWGTRQGILARTLRGHGGPVLAVALHPGGRLALTGADDRTARLWDIATGQSLRVLSGHRGKVTGVALSLDGARALTASADGTAILWDLADAKPLSTMNAGAPIASLALSFDNRFALTGDADRSIRLWELSGGHDLRIFDAGGAGVNGLAFAADGRFALSAGADGLVRHWTLDWELAERDRGEWDEAAAVYLTDFLTRHTPYVGVFPAGRAPFEKEVVRALSKEGAPIYDATDVDDLMTHLGYAGFGWLTRGGVENRLKGMAKKWTTPPTPIEPPDEPAEAEEEEGFDSQAATEIGAAHTTGLTGWMRSLTSRR